MSRTPSTITLVIAVVIVAAGLLFAALGALPTSDNGAVTLTSPYITVEPATKSSTALQATDTTVQLIPSAVPMPQAITAATAVPVGLPINDGTDTTSFTATKPGPQQPTPSITAIPMGLPIGEGAVTKPANGQ